MKDYFEHIEELPENVQKVLKKYEAVDSNDYPDCQNLVDELIPLGYTCEYALDGIPYDLRPMTPKEIIIDSNKLIANFMGAKYGKECGTPMGEDELWLPVHGICTWNTVELGNGKTLHYNDSWDWLMPVVEKIETIPTPESEFAFFYLKTWRKHVTWSVSNGYEYSSKLSGFTGKTRIEMFYNAVIGFIRWYNEKNK